MSTNNALTPVHWIIDGVMTGTDTITSPAVDIGWLDGTSVQLQWTGNPTGTFYVEGSLDYSKNVDGTVKNPGTWVTLVLPATPVAAGVDGKILIDLPLLTFPFIRVEYVNSAGDGVLNSYVCAKDE